MPAPPLESPDRTGIESLADEWRKTGAWMENAAAFVGERVWDAEAELRQAGELVVLGFSPQHGFSDLPAAAARVLRARQYAVEAIVSQIGNDLDDIRKKVGEPLLQERFPENKYGRFLRQLARAAEMSRAAKDSNEARDELLLWAESELPLLRELREDLRAAEPAMLGEKNARARRWRRETGLIVAGILIGLAGVLLGLLF